MVSLLVALSYGYSNQIGVPLYWNTMADAPLPLNPLRRVFYCQLYADYEIIKYVDYLSLYTALWMGSHTKSPLPS